MLIYCDCQDVASKFKHLLDIRMIIERHMPHLWGSLPFIDHVTQMQMDLNTEIVVAVEVERVEETNPTTSEIESFMSKIHLTVVKALQPCNYCRRYTNIGRCG